MSEQKITRFKESLYQVNWSEVLDTNDVDCAYDKFIDTMLSVFNTYFPIKPQSKPNYKKLPSRSPWITRNILRSINRKNNLF